MQGIREKLLLCVITISYPKEGLYSSSSEGKSSAGPSSFALGLCFINVGMLNSPS